MTRFAFLAIAGTLLVAGCGSTPGERSVTGAGIGASAGAVLGAVTGLSVVHGALIGAGAGGLTGALTRKDQINLGEPVWKWGSASREAHDTGLVRNIQGGLTRLGYNPGPADGVMGQNTFRAIRKYQARNKLPVDGQPSRSLEQRILRDSNRA